MSMPWRDMAAALRYGYAVQYVMRIDSLPTLFVEAIGDAIAPAGYDLDASLVVDRSAKVGSVVDPETHLGRAFDLEARLIDTAKVREYMAGPQRFTVLADDITAAATSMRVASTGAWTATTGRVWVDRELVPFGGRTADVFSTLTRGSFGRATKHGAGTVVTDAPTEWDGLRVELFAVLIDPMGRYVQGADILSDACARWAGYIATRPEYTGSEWAFSVRDQVRRLSQGVGVAASGTIVQEVDDDALWPIDPATTISMRARLWRGTVIFEALAVPFAGLSGNKRASQIRQLIADAMAAATAGVPEVLGWAWQLEDPAQPDQLRAWQLYVSIDTGIAADFGSIVTTVTSARETIRGGGGDVVFPDVVQSLPTGLRAMTIARDVGVAMILDEVGGGGVPSTGVLAIEGNGRVDYKRFTAATVDPNNAARIDFTIARADRFGPRDLWAVQDGQRTDLSGRVMWAASGTLPDIIRRIAVSTGEGVHGAWDVLPDGQGLGLPDLDSDSFDREFGALFDDLAFDVVVDAGTSLAEVFGGVLRLSRRAVVTRCADDGSAVEVAAISVASADRLDTANTVADEDLVASPGRRPVRVVELWGRPQVIQLRTKLAPIGETEVADGLAIYRDASRRRENPITWRLEAHGIGKAAILDAGTAWATAWFRAAQNYQVLEIDVAPWAAVEPGDSVRLELRDPAAWDYARAVPRISTWGRCIGAQTDLATQVTTITVAIDGVFGSRPMSPSLPILAVNGTATSPTSIDVDEDYVDLLVSAKDGQSSWQVLAYRPGYDYGLFAYTVSTITQPGGGVARLTVTGLPAVTQSLTTDFRLTFPVAADGTDWQNAHLHNTDRAQWS